MSVQVDVRTPNHIGFSDPAHLKKKTLDSSDDTLKWKQTKEADASIQQWHKGTSNQNPSTKTSRSPKQNKASPSLSELDPKFVQSVNSYTEELEQGIQLYQETGDIKSCLYAIRKLNALASQLNISNAKNTRPNQLTPLRKECIQTHFLPPYVEFLTAFIHQQQKHGIKLNPYAAAIYNQLVSLVPYLTEPQRQHVIEPLRTFMVTKLDADFDYAQFVLRANQTDLLTFELASMDDLIRPDTNLSKFKLIPESQLKEYRERIRQLRHLARVTPPIKTRLSPIESTALELIDKNQLTQLDTLLWRTHGDVLCHLQRMLAQKTFKNLLSYQNEVTSFMGISSTCYMSTLQTLLLIYNNTPHTVKSVSFVRLKFSELLSDTVMSCLLLLDHEQDADQISEILNLIGSVPNASKLLSAESQRVIEIYQSPITQLEPAVQSRLKSGVILQRYFCHFFHSMNQRKFDCMLVTLALIFTPPVSEEPTLFPAHFRKLKQKVAQSIKSRSCLKLARYYSEMPNQTDSGKASLRVAFAAHQTQILAFSPLHFLYHSEREHARMGKISCLAWDNLLKRIKDQVYEPSNMTQLLQLYALNPDCSSLLPYTETLLCVMLSHLLDEQATCQTSDKLAPEDMRHLVNFSTVLLNKLTTTPTPVVKAKTITQLQTSLENYQSVATELDEHAALFPISHVLPMLCNPQLVFAMSSPLTEITPEICRRVINAMSSSMKEKDLEAALIAFNKLVFYKREIEDVLDPEHKTLACLYAGAQEIFTTRLLLPFITMLGAELTVTPHYFMTNDPSKKKQEMAKLNVLACSQSAEIQHQWQHLASKLWSQSVYLMVLDSTVLTKEHVDDLLALKFISFDVHDDKVKPYLVLAICSVANQSELANTFNGKVQLTAIYQWAISLASHPEYASLSETLKNKLCLAIQQLENYVVLKCSPFSVSDLLIRRRHYLPPKTLEVKTMMASSHHPQKTVTKTIALTMDVGLPNVNELLKKVPVSYRCTVDEEPTVSVEVDQPVVEMALGTTTEKAQQRPSTDTTIDEEQPIQPTGNTPELANEVHKDIAEVDSTYTNDAIEVIPSETQEDEPVLSDPNGETTVQQIEVVSESDDEVSQEIDNITEQVESIQEGVNEEPQNVSASEQQKTAEPNLEIQSSNSTPSIDAPAVLTSSPFLVVPDHTQPTYIMLLPQIYQEIPQFLEELPKLYWRAPQLLEQEPTFYSIAHENIPELMLLNQYQTEMALAIFNISFLIDYRYLLDEAPEGITRAAVQLGIDTVIQDVQQQQELVEVQLQAEMSKIPSLLSNYIASDTQNSGSLMLELSQRFLSLNNEEFEQLIREIEAHASAHISQFKFVPCHTLLYVKMLLKIVYQQHKTYLEHVGGVYDL
ncbi:hypothetical protein [Parashewanella tropica]|uniref:hypothetical protein n=1 Tax=Parashewanella tropica TaxID=2547970 RepID=UPI00105A9D78|nr:hypothetical protein [Parashewanella tropica]